jgi:hypothetical protein
VATPPTVQPQQGPSVLQQPQPAQQPQRGPQGPIQGGPASPRRKRASAPLYVFLWSGMCAMRRQMAY